MDNEFKETTDLQTAFLYEDTLLNMLAKLFNNEQVLHHQQNVW